MCGILGQVGGDPGAVELALDGIAHRGPDARGVAEVDDVVLGHTRLAIQDLDPRSDQPYRYGSTTLAFNGEVWNWREVRSELGAEGLAFSTEGDTEVVAAALDRWGEAALDRLNGMFALAWTDGSSAGVRLARDRYGEVPLHYAAQWPFRFGSERKALIGLGAHRNAIRDVGPGEVVYADDRGMERRHYYDAPADPSGLSLEEAAVGLRGAVRLGAHERAISDVPVCTLLSGGIDSAAVALFLRERVPNLVAYTAVFDRGSRDLKMARRTAEALGIELREVGIPMPRPEDLARVVRTIEQPFKAQVEIGWACLVLAERMREDGHKVVFSGEGSDELWASYGFAYHALNGPKAQDWHLYRKGLFLDQARKNFARCNKVFMAYGVECRLPFLHPPLVELALSLREGAVREGRSRPKAVLQRAVEGLLPEEVVWRPKVAFQDGLGLKEAIAGSLGDPKRFYRAEYGRVFGRGKNA